MQQFHSLSVADKRHVHTLPCFAFVVLSVALDETMLNCLFYSQLKQPVGSV